MLQCLIMNNSIIKKIFNGAYFGLFTNIYSAISALIWIPLALKTLGPEEYAKSVSISIFYANGIISIILLGNQSTALKYSAEFWENSIHKVFSLYKFICLKVVKLSLIGVLVFFIFSNYLINFLSLTASEEYIFYVVIFSIPFQFLNIINFNFINGNAEFKLTQRVTFIQEFIKVTGIFFFLIYYQSFIGIVISIITSQFMGLLITSIILNRRIIKSKEVIHNTKLNEIKTYQKHLSIQNTISAFLNGSDKLLGTLFLTPTLLAYMDIILKLPILMNRVIFTSLNGIIPSISPLEKNIKEYFTRGLSIFTLICSYLSIITYFFSDLLYTIWLQNEYLNMYSDVGKYFSIWLLFLPMLFSGTFLISKNVNLNRVTLFRFLQAFIKISIFIIFIKTFGLYAIPLAYVLSLLPSLILNFSMKELSIYPNEIFTEFFKSIFFIFLFSSPILLIENNIIALTYIIILFLIHISIKIKYIFNKSNK